MANLFFFLPVILAATNTPVENYGNFNNVEYVRNYDGDTITVNIPNVHDIIGNEIPIRVKGIDTPEINGNCQEEIIAAKEARDVVASQISNSTTINILNSERDKYFRILGDVEYDGVNLATFLLNSGYALPYTGGTKPNWCAILTQ
jgi:micrococcal nuclease